MMAAVASVAPPIGYAIHGKRGREDDDVLPSCKRYRSTSVNSVTSHASSYVPAAERADENETPDTPQTPMSRTASDGKIFKCPYDGCDKAYNRPTRLKDHINSHTQERPHICPHIPCTKAFLRQCHLARHIKLAHTDIRNFVCTHEGCNKTYATGTRLRRHIADTHEGKEKFQCTGYEGCSQTFRKKKTLQSHIDRDHFNCKPFPCTLKHEATGEQCDKAYLTEYKLLGHQRKHHNSLQYICTQCSSHVEGDDEEVIPPIGIYFATTQDLAIHIQQVHPPRCEACDQTFASTQLFEKHMETLHSGKTLEERKTFCCPEVGCNKAFTKQSNLNQHFRSAHQDLRQFVCGSTDLSRSKGIEEWSGDGACDANFTTKHALENHVRVQHLGQQDGVAKNRKQLRQEKKSANRQAKGLSVIGALTGDAYAEETRRGIECIVSGCDHLFYRQYDLEVHAQATHGLEIEEVLEAVAEREALNGGRFWIGGIDPGREDSHNHHVPDAEQFAADGQFLANRVARAMEPLAGAGVSADHAIDPMLF